MRRLLSAIVATAAALQAGEEGRKGVPSGGQGEGISPLLEIQYVSWRKLRLPCRYTSGGTASITGLKLWWTADGAQTWHAFPAEGFLVPKGTVEFEAPEDGTYGFRLQAFDAAGRFSPEPGPGDEPTTVVVVDTQPPRITIHSPRAPQAFYAGQVIRFRWELLERNLSSKPVSIFYLQNDDPTPLPLDMERDGFPARGDLSWALPLSEGSISFLFVAVDKAGNKAQERCGPFPIENYLKRLGPQCVVAEGYSRHLCVPVFYRFPGIDPSEVGSVEVYWRRADFSEPDPAWHLAGVDADCSSPFVFQAPQDGRYALRVALKAKDGKTYLRGISARSEGDVVTVIDTHDPQLEILSVNGSRDDELWVQGGEKLEVSFVVRERNLPPESVTVLYSLDGGATWHLLAEKVPARSGEPFSFRWTMPRITAEDFQLKIQATDAVGRTGSAVFSGRIHVRDKQAAAVVDTRSLLQRGELALSRGSKEGIEAAVKLLRTAVGFSPRDPRARWAYAEALRAAGKRKEALIQLRKAVELLPSEVSYRLKLVEELVAFAEKTRSERLFEEAQRHLEAIRMDELYLRSDFALLREKYRAAEEALRSWKERRIERVEGEK